MATQYTQHAPPRPPVANIQDLENILAREVNQISLKDLEPWDDVIDYISKTGDSVLPWLTLRRLLIVYFSLTLQLMITQTRVAIPDLENNITEQSIILCMEDWQGPPFTLQRIGELLIEQIRPPDSAHRHPSCPTRVKRHYRNPTSFLIAFSKCVVGITDIRYETIPTSSAIIDPADFLYYDRVGQPVLLRDDDVQQLLGADRTRHMRVLGVGPLTPEGRLFADDGDRGDMDEDERDARNDVISPPFSEDGGQRSSNDFTSRSESHILTESISDTDNTTTGDDTASSASLTPRKRFNTDTEDEDEEDHPRKRSLSESRLQEDYAMNNDDNGSHNWSRE